MTKSSPIEEMVVKLKDIDDRRLAAFSSGSGLNLSSKEHLRLMAEATTREDVDTLNEAFSMLDDFSRVVTTLREGVWAEFEQGYRCGVCGRTSKQNAAIGYDCIREC